MRIGFIQLSLLVAFWSAGCSTTREAGILRHTEKQFARKIAKPGYRILDVRTPREYDSAHIPGSILANFLDSAAFARALDTLPRRERYLVYCRSGKRSLDAASLMRTKGFKKVADLEGGLKAWKGTTIATTPKATESF